MELFYCSWAEAVLHAFLVFKQLNAGARMGVKSDPFGLSAMHQEAPLPTGEEEAREGPCKACQQG